MRVRGWCRRWPNFSRPVPAPAPAPRGGRPTEAKQAPTPGPEAGAGSDAGGGHRAGEGDGVDLAALLVPEEWRPCRSRLFGVVLLMIPLH